jgi:single-strand DNA-binding protein
MAGSLNKVTLIGNLGADPEVKTFENGGKICNISVATSESWKDRESGERKEKTEWHNVVVKNPNLVDVIEKYLKKGSKVYLEGSLSTRKYEKDGTDRWTTEVVLQGYSCQMVMLDSKESKDSKEGSSNSEQIPF